MKKRIKEPPKKKFQEQLIEEGCLPFKLFRIFSYPSGRDPVPHEEFGYLKDRPKMENDVYMNNILFPYNPQGIVRQEIQMVDAWGSKIITERLITKLKHRNFSPGSS